MNLLCFLFQLFIGMQMGDGLSNLPSFREGYASVLAFLEYVHDGLDALCEKRLLSLGLE
jgi:hypothetical protein